MNGTELLPACRVTIMLTSSMGERGALTVYDRVHLRRRSGSPDARDPLYDGQVCGF